MHREDSNQCSLCDQWSNHKVPGPFNRTYYRCKNCELIFVDPSDFISEKEELRRYDLHENNSDDEGYQTFLKKAVEPALLYLNDEMQGLDYGSGLNKVLSLLLKEQGIKCDNFDYYYHPELEDKKYEFIFSTETFEHFTDPKKELEKIDNLLVEGGYLVVMTKTWISEERFEKWHYARDYTHVSFFNVETFHYIAKKWKYRVLENIRNTVFILQKSN
ncbi:class I SAM-dependent methyltransferase [Salibacter halophilus]|uniref:class I SAM-dependent methyltransferase n=1 Tax=Salibacter halophilus TaxID=1803916 RepID=UPI0014780A1E|nr:class I SAM-dependent methyltransferase [Salibacter halophilus]